MSSRLVFCGGGSDQSVSDVNSNNNNEKCGICGQLTSSPRRKRICTFCLQSVCSTCIPLDPRSRNQKVCSICQVITCSLTTRSELEKLKTQHLVRFVDANRIDRRGCRDKAEIVELILRSRARVVNTHACQQSQQQRVEPPAAPQQQCPTMGHSNSRPTMPGQQQQGCPRQSRAYNPSNHSYQQWFNGFEQSMSSLASGMSSLANQMVASANAFRSSCPVSVNVAHQTSPLFQTTTTTVVHPPGDRNRTMTTMTTRMTIQPEQQAAARTYRTSQQPSSARRPQSATPRPTPVMPSILLTSLRCEEDIDKMTTKQMKELLDFHLVSTRGCIERSDLATKVKELLEDEKQKRRLRDQNEIADPIGRDICKICMDDAVDCVFVECGHMVSCLECGKKLQNCPICRQNIVRVIKTFRS